MTKPLSAEALAIWNAFNDVSERVGVFEDYGEALAAALRALVEPCAPADPEGHWIYIRKKHVLAIADEFEAAEW